MTTSLFGVGASVNVNAAGSLIPQSFVGIAAQTVFTLTAFTYTPGTNSLLVFVNGQKQVLSRDFVETSTSSFTLSEGVVAGDFVDIIGFPQVTLIAALAGAVSFTQALTGALASTVQAKLQQQWSVTDLINTFDQAAILGGGTYHIPNGSYARTGTISCDYSSPTFPGFPLPSPRVSILGESMSNVFLNYAGAAGTYALALIGPATFANEGVYSDSEYGGFTIVDVGGTRTRNGVNVTNLVEVKLRDITFYNLNIGLYWNSSLSSILSNLKFYNCNIGTVLDNTTGQSNPNSNSFRDLSWTGCVHNGLIANVMGAGNKFSLGRVESCGTQGAGADGGMTFNIRTDNGASSMSIENYYFEGNAGGSDLFFTLTDAGNATVTVRNCQFDRVSNLRFTSANIGGANSSTGVLKIIIQGCDFKSANSYVPSSARPFFAAADNKVIFIDGGGNTFSEDTSRVAAFFSAGCRVNGSTGAILTGASGWTCVRNSAGNYTVTSAIPLGPTTNDISVSVNALSAGALVATAAVPTSNSITVLTKTMNTAAATDSDFSLIFAGLKG